MPQQPDATRRRLLDATFACIVELGYARTSTAEVCRRANTARGTMLHHFPTKEALVLGAMDDVLQRRLAEFIAELPDEADPAELVSTLWRAIRGDTFNAWLELAVAARTDDALRPRWLDLVRRFDAEVTAVAGALFPAGRATPTRARYYVSFVFAVLNGLAMDRLFKRDDEVEPVVDLLVDVANAFGVD